MTTKRNLVLFLLPVGILLAIVTVGVVAMYAMFMNITAEPEEEQAAISEVVPYAGGPVSVVGQGEIPPEFIPVYQDAAKKYGIPWNLLAGIHRVETVFSTIGIENMESYAGAIGHMQFMPCTWTGWGHPSCGGLGRGAIPAADLVNPSMIKKHGGFGIDGDGDGKADPFSLVDSVFSAANYLAQNGAAKGDYRKAVFTYNHSEKYVSDVLGFMEKYVNYSPAPPPKAIQTAGGFNRPIGTAVTSRYGNRLNPVLDIWRLHAGIDFDCVTGDAIRASMAGTVSYAGWQSATNPKAGLGLYVWIEHPGGMKTSYGHMSALAVRVGQQVNAGDAVGACGTTGTSSGDHLHFEIFKNGIQVDPAPFLGIR